MSEPPPFPDFFVNGMLRAENWPREIGRFKKKWVVDAQIVDSMCFQLAQLGVTLGATRPRLALQLLADIFRTRDWEKKPLSALLVDLDPSARISAAPAQKPWHSIVTLRLAEYGASMGEQLIPWELLAHENYRAELSISCAAGLVWGLIHPSEATEAIDRESARLNQDLPRWKQAGLAVDPGYEVPNVWQAGINAEDMLTSYQVECRPLIPLPSALAASPEIAARLD